MLPISSQAFRESWNKVLIEYHSLTWEKANRIAHHYFEKGLYFSLIMGGSFALLGGIFSFYTTLPMIAFKVAFICLLGSYFTHKMEDKKGLFHCKFVQKAGAPKGIERTTLNGCYINAAFQILKPILSRIKDQLEVFSPEQGVDQAKLASLYLFIQSFESPKNGDKETYYPFVKDFLVQKKVNQIMTQSGGSKSRDQVEKECANSPLSSEDMHQEDLMEFIAYFFQKVDETYNKAFDQGDRTNCIWEQAAGFSYDVKIKGSVEENGTQVKKSSTTSFSDPFLQFCLEVRGSLQDSMNAFFASEPVNNYQMTTISPNKNPRRTLSLNATKQTFLKETAPFLLLSLNRFIPVYQQNERGEEVYVGAKKISDPIEEAFTFTLSSGWFDEGKRPQAGIQYDLIAFSVHLGPSMNGGHYVTYRKEGEVWYKFDDAEVTQVTSEQLEKAQKQLYEALYERRPN